MKSKITDMTIGSPSKHILVFALPLFIGNVFQQFYNMVDSIIVGNFVGPQALAAVGTCGSMNFLFFSFCSGLATGIGIIVSQYFGAKDDKNVRSAIANSGYVLGSVGIIIGLIGVTLSPHLLKLISCPDSLLADATIYLRVVCTGIVFVTVYNGAASILRALGDSKTPLYFLIISSVLNLVLDLLFVLQLKMGVLGVAVATVISQAISAITLLLYAFKTVSYFKFTKDQLKPNRFIIIKSFKLGVPVSLQFSMIAVSCMVLQRFVNSFGETVMAAYTIEMRIEQLVQQPFGSIGMALTTYSGQNLGAKNLERVKKGFWRGTLFVFILSAFFLPMAFLFSENIVSLFVKDADVIYIGATALKITSVFFFELGMIYIPRSVLTGCGDSTFAMINGISEVVCRIIFSALFARFTAFTLFGNTIQIGYWGVWLTSAFTWAVTGLVCILRYSAGRWKKMFITE